MGLDMYYNDYYSDYYSEGTCFCHRFRMIDVKGNQNIRAIIEAELKNGKSLACVRIRNKENVVEQVEYYCIDNDYPFISDMYDDAPFEDGCVIFCKYDSSGDYTEDYIKIADSLDYYLEFDINPPLSEEDCRHSLFEYEYYISEKPINRQEIYDVYEGAFLFYMGMCMRVGCNPRIF